MQVTDLELVEQIEAKFVARELFWTAPWWTWKVWKLTSTEIAIGILRKRESVN